MKYIAKEDNGFKPGTEVELIEDYSTEENKLGLFKGIFVIDNKKWLKVKDKGKDNNVGNEVIDYEVCNFDEFIIEE